MPGDPSRTGDCAASVEGAAASTPTRVLALDVGRRRIGLALSDPLGITAQPLFTLHRTTERADIRSIARVLRRHAVSEVVVGDPVHLSGELSPQAVEVRRFAVALAAATGVALHLVDERLTTAEAHALLDRSRARGVASRRARRERETVIDQVAAVVLLEGFLAARSPRLLPPPGDL